MYLHENHKINSSAYSKYKLAKWIKTIDWSICVLQDPDVLHETLIPIFNNLDVRSTYLLFFFKRPIIHPANVVLTPTHLIKLTQFSGRVI